MSVREESEISLGRFADSDFWIMDVAKISTFNKYIKTWDALLEKHPDEVIKQFEDDVHIIYKIHKDRLSICSKRNVKINPTWLRKNN